ncbi:MAG: ComEA family DNA-binding protein [Thermodesulfobacteriota bacterium]
MKPLKKSDDVGACLALLLLILGLGLADSFFRKPAAPPLPCTNPLFVEAAGDVHHPGVYVFCDTPATTSDLAVRASGRSDYRAAGIIENTPLPSGARVVFMGGPGKEKTCRIEDMSAFYLFTLGMPVPVNRSSAEDLTALPGIGPGLAWALVEYREHANGFDRVEDLLRVHGIGPRTLELLKPHITVRRTGSLTGPQ